MKNYLFKYGWIFAFVLLCTVFYEQGLRNRNELFQHLTKQKINLLEEKEKALAHNRELQNQINSQSDQSWIELTLKKGLGLVPVGEQKVYFFPNNTLISNGEKND